VLHTPCPKNVTNLSRYNSDICESILIIFGTNLAEKAGNQKVYFPTSANSFDSEGWFWCDQVIFLCVSYVFSKKHAVSEKSQLLGFLFFQVVQKH